jgi:hypothetical protein
LRLACVLALCAAALAAHAEERTLDIGGGKSIRYSVLDAASPAQASATGTALQIVRLLADGRIEEASVLSNSPQRRLEVLRDYRASVGEQEFRRVFGQFLRPENRVMAELAMERHRLVIWDLGEADHHLAAQYFVEADGKFVLDDVPSEARANLRRVLQSYRASRSAKPDG